MHKKLLPKITAEEIQNTAKDFMKNRGNFLFVEIPEKNTEIPDDNNELRNLWKNYKNESIIAYEDDSTETGLGNKPSTKASIVKTEKIKELDTSVYELSNGAKIILKKTDFDKNSILFSAFSYGGLSKYKQKDILSAKYSTFYAIQSGINGLTYAQMSKALAGSTATISNISINPYAESMSGKSSTQDIETLLNLVYQFSANPQFSDDSWNNLMPQLQMMADTRDAQPQQVFINKINELIFGNDVRFLSAKPKDLDFMNKEQSAKIFKECFGNAADFTYTFVGDFDEDYLLELCQYYIGNIPGDKSKCDTVKFNEKTFPNGNIRETIKKGIGNQGMVYIAFGGNLKSEKDVTANWIRAETTYPLSSLLSIKLREEIRENLGGTYNISAQIGGLSSNDISEPSNFISEFSFDCEPERADELKNAVIKTLKELSEQPIDDATLTKILEEYKRDKEKNLRSNNWWINELECALVLKLEPISSLHDYETIPSGLTKDNIQKLIKKYCNTDDYMCVILLPENE
ncbi:MAG: insulinase family protein [Treponema sp.]|nr:insulinase family protein [Treponema sp.]